MGDVFVESLALANGGWARLGRGEPRPDLFARHLDLSLQLGNEDGVGFALEGLAACRGGRRHRARRPAARRQRDRAPAHRPRRPATRPDVPADRRPVLASDRADEFESARARGRRMPRRAVLDLVLDPAGTVVP
jgi:hypothetical protein